MYSFMELKKASKLDIPKEEIRVAVLGNSATQCFSIAIQGYARLKGLNAQIFDSDYNQIDSQLLNLESPVYKFKPDIILIWLATDSLYEEFLNLPFNEKGVFAETVMCKISNYWSRVQQNFHSKIMQLNFTEFNDKVLGNYSCKIETTFIYQIRKLNYLLQEAMMNNKNVYPVDLSDIQIQIGREQFYDAALYYNAKMTIALNALPYVAKTVTEVLLSMNGKIKKCVILDLDDTLWGGIIGDDGLVGIEIGSLGRGHAFENFQRWLKQLKQNGVILAICSKNDENIARYPFEYHDEMVLRLSDISVFVANWNDKASNIRMIQENLNIGMDSIVFLDDNPFERELVRSMLPEVEVPELPEDPALYLNFLQKCNCFDTINHIGEDYERTKQYQIEFERRKLQANFVSIDEYLKDLEMFGKSNAFIPEYYARIAQLTQRSNQFNLRTIRYTEDEVERIANDKNYITLYFTLRDKFGDYGLISVVIMKKISDTELFIDTWLMSCRVLKRGVENFVINKVVQIARKNGYRNIFSEYVPTNKNSMVENIYKTMGFTQTEEHKYCLVVDKYQKKDNFIEEEI